MRQPEILRVLCKDRTVNEMFMAAESRSDDLEIEVRITADVVRAKRMTPEHFKDACRLYFERSLAKLMDETHPPEMSEAMVRELYRRMTP